MNVLLLKQMMKIVIYLIKIKLVKNVKMVMQLKMEFVLRLILNFVKFLKILIIVKSVFQVMEEEYNHLLQIVLELIKNFVRFPLIFVLYLKINVFLIVLLVILVTF